MDGSIGFLGGGQLGMMMGEAAKRLGFEVEFLDPKAGACASSIGPVRVINDNFSDERVLRSFSAHSHITYEWENVPQTTVEFLQICGAKVHPNVKALCVSSDRVLEKRFFEDMDVPVPKFHGVNR